MAAETMILSSLMSGGGQGGGGAGMVQQAGQVGANYAGAGMALAELALGDKPTKPPLEDPEQRNRLNKLLRDNRSRFTGSYAASAQDMLEGQLSAITEGIKSSSGSSGEMLKAMLGASDNAGEGFNKVLSNIENQALQREGLITKLINDISQRKLELQMVDYLEDKADREQAKSAFKSNLMGAMSMGSAGGGQGDTGSGQNQELMSLLSSMFGDNSAPPTQKTYKMQGAPPVAGDPVAPNNPQLSQTISGFGSEDLIGGPGSGRLSNIIQ